jgi:predicted nuclease of restriction endonuclease-like (RecB) superfamily
MSVEKHEAHTIYEAEALRGGWTVRQIGTPFYQRTLLSRDKAAMLRKGRSARPGDTPIPSYPS